MWFETLALDVEFEDLETCSDSAPGLGFALIVYDKDDNGEK